MISTPTGMARTSISIFAIVQLALAQHLAESLPGIVVARRAIPGKAGLGSRQQDVEHSVLRAVGRPVAHLGHFLFSGHFDGDVDKIADDRINFAANIAHFGEFGGFHLDEGRLGEPRQPSRDLGLADAGGADHENVLRRDLRAQRFGDLLAPPAIAQRNRHRALGGLLADDVLVELLDDFARRHLRHRGPTVPRWSDCDWCRCRYPPQCSRSARRCRVPAIRFA